MNFYASSRRRQPKQPPWWVEVIAELESPIEVPAKRIGRDLIIERCPLCKRRHTHGSSGNERVGDLTHRVPHCYFKDAPQGTWPHPAGFVLRIVRSDAEPGVRWRGGDDE
jgi:hypothetical protein